MAGAATRVRDPWQRAWHTVEMTYQIPCFIAQHVTLASAHNPELLAPPGHPAPFVIHTLAVPCRRTCPAINSMLHRSTHTSPLLLLTIPSYWPHLAIQHRASSIRHRTHLQIRQRQPSPSHVRRPPTPLTMTRFGPLCRTLIILCHCIHELNP